MEPKEIPRYVPKRAIRLNGFLTIPKKKKKFKCYLRTLKGVPQSHAGMIRKETIIYAVKNGVPHKRLFLDDTMTPKICKATGTQLFFFRRYDKVTGEVFCNKFNTYKFYVETPELRTNFEKFHAASIFFDMKYADVPLHKIVEARNMFYEIMKDFITLRYKKRYAYITADSNDIQGVELVEKGKATMPLYEISEISKEFDDLMGVEPIKIEYEAEVEESIEVTFCESCGEYTELCKCVNEEEL